MLLRNNIKELLKGISVEYMRCIDLLPESHAGSPDFSQTTVNHLGFVYSDGASRRGTKRHGL